MKQLIKLMNREVANLGVMYTKLHNYHWLVTGPQFYNLHVLLEKLYDEVTEHFDAVAERILMLDEKPVATLKEFLDLATIKEASGKEASMEMIKVVLDDFKLLDNEFSDIIKKAQELGDEVTADLFIGMSKSLQKHIWMLTATLQ